MCVTPSLLYMSAWVCVCVCLLVVFLWHSYTAECLYVYVCIEIVVICSTFNGVGVLSISYFFTILSFSLKQKKTCRKEKKMLCAYGHCWQFSKQTKKFIHINTSDTRKTMQSNN